MQSSDKNRHDAADHALRDIVFLLGGTMQKREIDYFKEAETELAGDTLVQLLERNFAKLDPDNNGISRDEISAALMKPNLFSVDEYAMLRLVAKYFDTIINLSDDEAADETVITRKDGEVLAQFLVHSKLKLSEMHRWVALANGTATEEDIGPPPLSR